MALVVLASAVTVGTVTGGSIPGVGSPPPAGAMAGNGPACSGYAEPRVFLESQVWWQPTLSGSEDFGHLHVGTCFPRPYLPDGTPNRIRGVVDFNVKITIHHNPFPVRFLRVATVNGPSVRKDLGHTCSTHTCEWWERISIDTREHPNDGFQEFRFTGHLRPDLDEMFQSTGWQAYLDNGKPVQHFRVNADGSPKHFIEGRGWYRGADYTNARLESPLPYVVSGTWEPSIRIGTGSNSSAETRRSLATIDPRFHDGSSGTILMLQPGPYRGKLSIDTTTLSDGWHRLVLRSEAPCNGEPGNDCGLKVDGSDNNVSTNSGLLVIPFEVRNNSPHPASGGYWMLGEHGHVYAFGGAQHFGAPDGVRAVDIEATKSGRGYWIVDAAGYVYSFGDAVYHGGLNGAGLAPGETVTSISTSTAPGYWIFTTAGRAFPFGEAPHVGDMAGSRLNGPVLDAIPTPSGQGYYMVASDGGIFTFGDADFRGSMGAVPLNSPVQSLAPDPDGRGYWLIASDGGIFTFDADFHGSMGHVRLNRPVTGMVASGRGYLMVAEDGGIFAFGETAFHGSLGADPPPWGIVGVSPQD